MAGHKSFWITLLGQLQQATALGHIPLEGSPPAVVVSTFSPGPSE